MSAAGTELRATLREPWARVSLAVVAVAVLAVLLGLRVNVSRSYPLGLYRVVGGAADVERGSVVVVCLPAEWSRFARARGYLGSGRCPGGDYGLGKMVLAAEGDVVELRANGVSVNGRAIPGSRPLARDGRRRSVPHPPFGRRRLRPGELWLSSPHSAGAFDSRYFGAVRLEWVREVVRPVWTTR